MTTDNAQQESAESNSTIDEISALAPLGEEWLRAVHRQYKAGRKLFSAEWSLVKKSLILCVAFALVFTAFLVCLLLTINGLIGYLLVDAGLSIPITILVLIGLNGWATVVCATTIKQLARHANFSRSADVFFKRSATQEENIDE